LKVLSLVSTAKHSGTRYFLPSRATNIYKRIYFHLTLSNRNSTASCHWLKEKFPFLQKPRIGKYQVISLCVLYCVFSSGRNFHARDSSVFKTTLPEGKKRKLIGCLKNKKEKRNGGMIQIQSMRKRRKT
jgi:hypothetical protein